MELRAETSVFDDKLLKEDIDNAQETADNAQVIAGTTAQYFWFLEEIGSVPEGVGTGAHITNLTKEEFLYNPANGGGNLLARSNGIAIRDGLTELAYFSGTAAQIGKSNAYNTYFDSQSFQIRDGSTPLSKFTSDGVDIYLANDSINSVANFGTTSRIGKSNTAHVQTTENGLNIYGINGADVVAQFGSSDLVQTFTYRKSLLNQKFIFGKSITFDELNSAINGTTINLRAKFQNIDSGGIAVRTLSFVKGTRSTQYAIDYDGIETFSHGNTDYDLYLLDLTYQVNINPGKIRLGNTETDDKPIVYGNKINGQDIDIFYVDAQGSINAMGDLLASNVGLTPVVGTTGIVRKNYPTDSGVWEGVEWFELDAGVYIVTACVQFASNSTGTRMANINPTAGNSWKFATVRAISGAITSVNFTIVLAPTSTTTYYVNAYQDSGSLLNCTTELYWVRIK